MGQWNFLGAAAFAVAVAITLPTSATAKSAWSCGFSDVSELVQVEAQREAALQQRIFITDDGRLEQVRIIVDEPPRRRDLLAADLKRRLGLVRDALTGALERQPATLKTELADWSLSPLGRMRQDLRPGC